MFPGLRPQHKPAVVYRYKVWLLDFTFNHVSPLVAFFLPLLLLLLFFLRLKTQGLVNAKMESQEAHL